MSEHLSEVAVHLLADKLVAIRAHAEECALSVRTTNSSTKLLAKYHVRVCDALIGFLTSMDSSDNEEYSSDVSRVFQAVRQLARMTRFFGASEGPLFRSDVLLPWTNTVKTIASDADVIIRAQSAYEFEGRLEIREMLDKLLPREISRTQVFRGFPRYFLVLNIPIVEGWNLLHQTLIAHEVGHFIFTSRQLETVSYNVVRDRYEEIENIYEEWKRLTRSELTTEQFHKQLSAIISSRFKELMSDIFAAQIIGPCVLPALRDFGLPGYALDFTIDDGQMFYYPSFRKRFRTLLRTLSPYWSGYFQFVNGGDADILNAALKDIRAWSLGLRILTPAQSPSLILIDEIVDACVDLALARTQDDRPWEYHPRVFRREIFELYNRIQDGIPPNELVIGLPAEGSPAAWQSVLNASWLHYCYGTRDKLDLFRFKPGGISETQATQRYQNLYKFNDFMTRSLEMAIVHRQFVEQKDQLEGILDDAIGEGD